MPGSNELLSHIQAEYSAAELLSDALHDERSLLEQRDLIAMQPLLERKAGLLTEIEAIRQRRQECVQRLGIVLPDDAAGGADPDALQTTGGKLPAPTLEALTDLNKLLRKCQERNELNGLLITNSRKRNRRRLDILKGVSRGQQLYDATGNTSTAAANKAYQRA